ncbi:hypothetical protein AB751O23_AD_00130 [Chlamydiales bacterium SCGC AB-751-O23]|jgi:hypothetical protein|nr:hypothetical protein AB751O23_AD_00130 [Chlamydiales bacterium SCGC AB-751-O23]
MNLRVCKSQEATTLVGRINFMSEIPEDPVFQRKLLNGSNEPSKKGKMAKTNAPSSIEETTTKEDVLDLSKADSESKASQVADKEKVANWVKMLMDDKQFPDVRKEKVEAAKERLKYGYENESEVLRETAKSIAREFGL